MADSMAGQHQHSSMIVPFDVPAKRIRASFDGSKTNHGVAFGWAVYSFEPSLPDDPEKWQLVATKSGVLPEQASITAAELEGASSVISFLQSYYQGYIKASANITARATMNYRDVQALELAELI